MPKLDENERNSYQEQACEEIVRSWTGEQAIIGPILVVPCTCTFRKQESNKNLSSYVDLEVVVKEILFILPDSLTGEVQLDTDIRYRGTYKVPVYSGMADVFFLGQHRRACDIARRAGSYSSYWHL